MPAVLASVNHETNTLMEWSFGSQGTPTIVVAPADMKGALAIQSKLDAIGDIVRITEFTSGSIYARILFRVNITTNPSSEVFFAEVLAFENTSFGLVCGVYMHVTSAGVPRLEMTIDVGTTGSIGSTFTIANNTTYVLEVKVIFDAVNGVAEWRLNGVVRGTSGPPRNTGTAVAVRPTLNGLATVNGMVAVYQHDALLIRNDAYPGGATIGDVFAPGIVGHGTASFTATANTPLAPTLPRTVTAADVSAGLMHVMLCHHSDNGPFTTPSGWSLTPASPTIIDDNNTAAQRVTVFLRRAQVGDGTPSVDLTTPGVATVRGAVIIGVGGVFGSTNTDGVDQCDRTLNAAAATISFPSVTTTTQHCLALALGAYEDDPTARTLPAGWNALAGAVHTSALGTGMALDYHWGVFTTGATGAFATTVSSGTFTNSPSVGAIIAFKGTFISIPDPVYRYPAWRKV